VSSGAAPKPRPRAQVVADLTDATRDLASWTLMLHQTIAAHFGLGPTDMKCLDLARGEENLTAGRLAEITGLSTSAVTSAVDRLEKRGFVERARDPDDRRKVIIRPTGAHDREAAAIFALVETGFTRMISDYDTESLEQITGFIRRCNDESSRLVPRIAAED
jgi:DNA-binding MarR family transcriptional regulator